MRPKSNTGPPESVRVRGVITLGQFLKFAGLASTGGEAKAGVEAGAVRVNGAVDTHRGRKLVDGDVVSFRGSSRRVSVAEDLSAPTGS